MASSLSFSFFCSAAVGSSGATKAICLPSGDHSNVAIFVAIGKKSEELAVGRPARRVLDFLGESVLADLASRDVHHPNVLRIICGLWRFADSKGQARAVWRKTEVGDTAQVQRLFGRQALASGRIGCVSRSREGKRAGEQ